MKANILALSFLFFGNYMMCQEYFNYRYDITDSGSVNWSTTIFQIDTGYIFGADARRFQSDISRISLVKLNLQGEQEWIKYYKQNTGGYEYMIGYPGFVIKTNPTGYAITGTRRDPYPGFVCDKGVLFRLDENFDTLWSHLYGELCEPCDTEYFFRSIRQLTDDGFVILAELFDYNALQSKVSLIRTDPSGNKIWEKLYGLSQFDYYPYSIAVTTDNGFALGGWLRQDGYSDKDPFIIKTDSCGNEEWFLNLGGDMVDGPYTCVDSTLDGNIIIGTILQDLPSGGNERGRIYYTKLDNNGNLIWQKQYGENKVWNRIETIRSLEDGNIVATGSTFRNNQTSPKPSVGWILYTSSIGDSLWYREYSILQGEYSLNQLSDVIPTDDNGYILCGVVYPNYPDTGKINTWVIKVDSLGCESPEFCWTYDNELFDTDMIISELVIYPNPASQIVRFEIDGTCFKKDTRIKIYNIFGEVMAQLFLATDEEFLKFNVTDWPTGIYLIRAEKKAESIRNGKFVVN